MKDLTPGTIIQKSKYSTTPINIIKIEFGGSVGTKYYSDRDLTDPVIAEGIVSDWGNLSAILTEEDFSAVSDVSINLLDADKDLYNIMLTEGFERKIATVYQWFAGLTIADLTPLIVGMINSPVIWDEKAASVSFDITDISTYYNKKIGQVADKDVFPYLSDEAANSVLPIVYGRVRRSPTVQVQEGDRTELVKRLTVSDAQLFVADGMQFPQNEEIKIIINNEVISGTMAGNVFTIIERGIIIDSDVETTHTASSPWRVKDASVPLKKLFINSFIIADIPGAGRQSRHIIGVDEDQDEFILTSPFNSGPTEFYTVPAGYSHDIGSEGTGQQGLHDVGAEVTLYLEKYIWVVNDAPSKAIYFAEVWGTKYNVIDTNDSEGAQVTLTKGQEGWIQLDPNIYEVNLNDTTSFPELGRPITTITMNRNPMDIPNSDFKNNEIYVDIEGWKDEEFYPENPADIIKHIISNYMEVPPSGINDVSFLAVKEALQNVVMGFTLMNEWDSLNLISNLAFQARSAITWEGGLATIQYLENGIPAPTTDLENDDREESSLNVEHTDFEEVITEINADYIDHNEEKKINIKDMNAQTLFGRRVKDISLWAYQDRPTVFMISNFWLNRWKHVYEILKLKTFLRQLEVERGDTVNLNIPGFFTNQPATILELDQQPGSGKDNKIDMINMVLRLPRFAGCQTNCEIYCETACEQSCETSACESVCQVSCEYSTCQSECQEGCEMYCTTTCELSCVSSCEASCQLSCETGCQTGCETNCQITCETSCQASCTTSCETDCQTTCESSCETSCQSGCETICVVGCQVTCQLDCQGSGCQIACENTGCQTTCQATCESACESMCEVCCEMGCESGCESSCETCCEVGCESTCEATCESAGCESSCQIGCETGCEMDCQTSCEYDACQAGACQIVCETGCQFTCQVSGCQLSCEASTCQTCCEYVCQSTCQSTCEDACQSSNTVTWVLKDLWKFDNGAYDTGDIYNLPIGKTIDMSNTQASFRMFARDRKYYEGKDYQVMTATTVKIFNPIKIDDGIEIFTYRLGDVPYESSCQTACETGCQSACELTCQSCCEHMEESS